MQHSGLLVATRATTIGLFTISAKTWLQKIEMSSEDIKDFFLAQIIQNNEGCLPSRLIPVLEYDPTLQYFKYLRQNRFKPIFRAGKR